MGTYRTVLTSELRPSQDYLKEHTVRYILKCLSEGNIADLPPTPIVRRDPASGQYIAIDGHNLIAVRDYRQEPLEVYIASSSEDGFLDTDVPGAVERNQELHQKYDTVLAVVTEIAEKVLLASRICEASILNCSQTKTSPDESEEVRLV